MELENVLHTIVKSDPLHMKWLNTLSYLENCGARKIALCEHPMKVQKEMLKHAAEEFRHAFFLKQQMLKLTHYVLPDYQTHFLLGGLFTCHFMERLDIDICRILLNHFHVKKQSIKEAAYTFVTYAIECRAGQLYPLYQAVLKKNASPVNVRSIILEEEEHLKEMQEELKTWPFWKEAVEKVQAAESDLFHDWLNTIQAEIETVLIDSV